MTEYRKDAAAIARLTPEQYRVTQEGDTERPGTGEYLHNKEAGIYVDIVSGEPLFASSDKFEFGCGWPSFTKPIEPANIAEKHDTQPRHGPHRSAFETRRQPPGPCLRRRPSRSRRLALLHQSAPRCASSRASGWRRRDMGRTSTRWRTSEGVDAPADSASMPHPI